MSPQVQALMDLTLTITGRKVSLNLDGRYSQDESSITVPGDLDDLGVFDEVLHELGHWIMASDKERTWPNLALDVDDEFINDDLPEEERLDNIDPETREYQTICLSRLVYDDAGLPIRDSHSAKFVDYYGKYGSPEMAYALERVGTTCPTIVREAARLLKELKSR